MHKKVRIGHAFDGTIKKEVLDSIWQEVTRLLFAEYSIPRVAHFLVENQETGKEGPGNFLQEIAVFLEISWF